MDFLDFSSYDTATWTTFLKENWMVLAIGLVLLFLVIRIVKTVVKWALVAIVVIGIVLYSGYSLDDVKEIGTKVMAGVTKETLSAMVGDAKDAKYHLNEDGTYTVKSGNMDLKGRTGVNEVQISLHGAPYMTIQIDDIIRTFINQAKQNG